MEEDQVLLHISDEEDGDGDPSEDQFDSIVNLECSPDLVSIEVTSGENPAYYMQQADGTRVQISFLPNAVDIDGCLPILSDELAYESETVSVTKLCDANQSSEILSLLGAESTHQVSAIQAPDGQIFYIEAYTVPESAAGSTQSQPLVPTKTKTEVQGTTIKADVKPKTTTKQESGVQVIGSDMGIEDRMRVMDDMLPKLGCPSSQAAWPGKVRKSSEDAPAVAEEPHYRCDMCHKSYARPHQLYGHSSSHFGERVLPCTQCSGKEFTAHGALTQHERRFHRSVRRHQCTLCAAKFERASQLSYHTRRLHLKERSFACPICGKTFFKRSDLKGHVNVHLGLDVKVCDTCGRVFNHVSNLNRHIRTHTGVKLYPCSECGRRFCQAGSLAKHKLIHDEKRLRTAACTVCDKSFRNRLALKRHMLLEHKEDSDPAKEPIAVRNENRTRNFYCRVCGETFQYLTLLKNHESIHVREKSMHCMGCDQNFNSMEDMVTHSCAVMRKRASEAAHLALDSQLENLLQSLQLRRAPPDVDKSRPEQLHKSSQKPTSNIVPAEDESGKHLEADNEQLLRFSEDTIVPLGNKVKDLASIVDVAEIIPSELHEDRALSESPTQVDDLARLENGEVLSLELESGEQVLVEMAEKEDGLFLQEDGLISIIAGSGSKTSGNEAMAADEVEPNEMPTSYDEYSDEGDKEDCADDVRTEKTVDIVITVASEEHNENKQKKTGRHACDICSKEFSKNGNYRQHLGTHFADQKQFECKRCEQTFAWKSTLNKHIMKYHQLEPRQKFPCEFCDKKYFLPTQVNEHVRRDHQKIRSHKCNLCPKVFFRKGDLSVHLRIHSGVKPYICGRCGKRFTHVSHIIRHEQSHLANKPFTCSKCSKQFTQMQSLRVHEKHPARCFCPPQKSARTG